MPRLIAVDRAVRAWVRTQVKDQQVELGKALTKAGLKGGQSWVSRYISGGPAIASIDHLLVMADFFERSLAEMLTEATGTNPLSGPVEQRTGTLSQDLAATLGEPEKLAHAIAFAEQFPPALRAWVLKLPKLLTAQQSTTQPSAPRRGRRAGGRTTGAQGQRQ